MVSSFEAFVENVESGRNSSTAKALSITDNKNFIARLFNRHALIGNHHENQWQLTGIIAFVSSIQYWLGSKVIIKRMKFYCATIKLTNERIAKEFSEAIRLNSIDDASSW